VNGTPAVAEDGAVKFKVACVVPQPNNIRAAITAINALDRDMGKAGHKLNRDFARLRALTHAHRAATIKVARLDVSSGASLVPVRAMHRDAGSL